MKITDRVFGVLRWRAFESIERFCLFVGYPRSGHSLIGALLNAHPNIVISHELDVVGLVNQGYRRNQLYSAVIDRDHWWSTRGLKWEGWSYGVEGQWQGRYETLRVIGDKAGGLTSRQVFHEPGVLTRLADVVEVPVTLIHHIRNPFDTIATMARKGQPGVDTVAGAIDRFFTEHVPGVEIACEWAGDRTVHLYHEDFVARPEHHLRMTCDRLGVDADADTKYVDACADLVHPEPMKSRSRVDWSPREIERVVREIERVRWLERYEANVYRPTTDTASTP